MRCNVQTHGTRGGYVNGCKCDECTRANTVGHRALVDRRAAARVLVDGRLVAVDAPVHGSSSTYTNWACRCSPCSVANTAVCAANRERRRRRKVEA